MYVGRGLSDEKVARVLTKANGLAESEVVWLYVKCNNLRPTVDALVVTNARVLGLSTVTKKYAYAQLLGDIRAVDFNSKARTVAIEARDGSGIIFKGIPSEDVPAVQHYLDYGRQNPPDAVLVDAIRASDTATSTPILAVSGPLANLPAKAQRKLMPALTRDERVVLACEGEFGAIVATERRILVVKWGLTSGALLTTQVNSWDLRQVVGVEVRKGMTSSSIVIQAPGTVPVTRFARIDKGPSSVWEAPNALFIKTGSSEPTADGVGMQLRELVATAQAPQHVHPAQPDLVAQIRGLGQLRDEGLITEDEFQTKKRDLLGL